MTSTRLTDALPTPGVGRSVLSDRPAAGQPETAPAEQPRRRKGRGGRGEESMVPEVEFTSYYGRPVVKAAPWGADIPAYLFLGGLAAGSSLLAAGADLTGRPSLRTVGRTGALVGIGLSFAALVHDLGRPARFSHMLRVFKPTSPMSVGTWILVGYGPLAGLAGAAELLGRAGGPGRLPAPVRGVGPLLTGLARPAGIGAALLAPAVASYTAVLLTDTATPTWSAARRELPWVFTGSAAAAAGGLGLLAAGSGDTGPALRLAAAGAAMELAASRVMEGGMGITAEPLHTGPAGLLMRASRALTGGGALLAVAGSVLARSGGRAGRIGQLTTRGAGLALLAGSACTRFGIFSAGQASARDPRYTVVPQRERLAARQVQPSPSV